jgi:NADPH-dependent 2,4-dienoyl-CoA reductase/sulfur reductase-like enzyme
MIVGGGPAGLTAARLAAQRGHQVTLYEKTPRLGGQLRLAAAPPYKEGFQDAIRFMELMARRAGAGIHTDTEVTPEMVQAAVPDVLIVATGGVPLSIPFPGLERTRWLLSSDLLAGSAEVHTDSALVIGGGLVGLEAADFLAARGKKVTLVEMLDDVGTDMDLLAKTMIARRLAAHGVDIHTATKVLRLTETEAIAQRDGRELTLPCETVVIAVGVRPDRGLADALAGTVEEMHVIGDAAEPRKALDAVGEGFDLGRRL